MITKPQGILYIVATPIGNLSDMSPRALETLASASLVAAEDTRHSKPLLRHFGITTPIIPFHGHNELEMGQYLIRRLSEGEAVALISDAGTPLISDPGCYLVSMAQRNGIKVVPIPGPCALVVALSASGLSSDRFVFEGFLPARQRQRRARLEQLRDDPRTLVFYEAPHRLLGCLEDMAEILGDQRNGVHARELTKFFEAIRNGCLRVLVEDLRDRNHRQKGESVILVEGNRDVRRSATEEINAETDRLLSILITELPRKQAVRLAAEISGVKKNTLYQRSLRLHTPSSSPRR